MPTLRSSLALTKLFHSTPNVMHKYIRLYRHTSCTQIACTKDIASDGEEPAFRNMRAVTYTHNLDLYTLFPELF